MPALLVSDKSLRGDHAGQTLDTCAVIQVPQTARPPRSAVYYDFRPADFALCLPDCLASNWAQVCEGVPESEIPQFIAAYNKDRFGIVAVSSAGFRGFLIRALTKIVSAPRGSLGLLLMPSLALALALGLTLYFYSFGSLVSNGGLGLELSTHIPEDLKSFGTVLDLLPFSSVFK